MVLKAWVCYTAIADLRDGIGTDAFQYYEDSFNLYVPDDRDLDADCHKSEIKGICERIIKNMLKGKGEIIEIKINDIEFETTEKDDDDDVEIH